MSDDKNDSTFDDDRLESLLKLQASLLTRVKKMMLNFGKDSKERKTLRVYYTTRLNQLGDCVTTFEANHREIIMMVPTGDQAGYDYFKLDQPQLFEDAQFDFLITVQAEYEKKFPEKPPTSRDKSEHLTSQVNLPTVSIPTFSGAHTDWKAFHDIFKSIVHSNEKIPGSHKFQYLLSALSGEARDLVIGYDLCDDDYPKAWRALTDVYNDKPSMFVHIMNKFSSLESTSKENPERLRELIKATASCLKSLESVGVDKKAVDAVITYYLIRKLPTDTLAYWEQVRDRTQLPSFESLQTCIETRIRVASTVAHVKTVHNHQSTSTTKAETSHSQQQQSTKRKVNAHQSSKASTISAGASSTPSNSSNTNNSSKLSGKKFECPVCKGAGHPLRACDKFLAMSSTDRKSLIVNMRYCVNCLAYNHQDNSCRSSHTCFTCGERHNTLLHISSTASMTQVVAHTMTNSTSSNVFTGNSRNPLSTSSKVLLATAIVTVLDANRQPHALRALIDQGSEANFITKSAVLALNLSTSSTQAVITGIGESIDKANSVATLQLRSQYSDTFCISIDALVMSKVTNLLPSSTIQPQPWHHLIGLTLADPSYHRSSRIDLVLGAEVFSQIIMTGVRIGSNGTPVAQQTRLGWILSGSVSEEKHQKITVRSHHASSNLESLMEKFLSAESIEDINPMTTEEQWCENLFVNTHSRNEAGRFQVRLPFRHLIDNSSSLGHSRSIAVKRLLQLERRFASNPTLKTEYAKAINDYLETGRMQLTTSSELECNGNVCSAYLPHHAVIKESSTTTKLRVVFDGSRQTSNGKSLNDVLIAGPKVQSDIVTIIINWRFHCVAFAADVQKMYLQVEVHAEDIQYQRIVWRNDVSEPIQDFCLNRLTFGTSCAPFLAIRAMNQLADVEKAKYPEAAIVIQKDAYVDDVLSGGDDVSDAKKLICDLNMMMKLGCFDLRKWASNVSDVLTQIPEADREVQLPVELNANDPIKALGIAWNTATDTFGFTFTIKIDENERITKRKAASVVATIFDPIGLIAPVIVVGKIIIKKLWAAEVDWDDSVPLSILDEWRQYINGLQHLKNIKIPRWINTKTSNLSVQFHGFCDASSNAYGAAIYLRTIDATNSIHCHLIASKSKVSPKKALTIPRLELCGAHLLSQLLASVRSSFRHVSVAAENVTLWCDSEIVCHWLRNEKPKKVFVENRVVKIKELTMGMRWRHIRTHENPADLVSRGTTPENIANNSLWWHGPSWLRTSVNNWPTSTIDSTIPPAGIDQELRHVVQANVSIEDTDIIHRFSDYNQLIRITALCHRFIHNCRHPTNRVYGIFTVDELKNIRHHWIRRTQRQHFFDEIKCLSNSPPTPIHGSSRLLSLCPFIDGNGILRVTGRLENASCSYQEKHPIIIPPKSHFTNLIIDRTHRRCHHGGPLIVASRLRREYWLLNPMRTINSRLHKCITCFRHTAKTSQQLMGSLPSPRVRQSIRAFLHTGVDYCGPINVRTSKYRGVKSYKGYIAVFVCLTVKAIHIECVDGLSTDAFLAAFKRFISRRGVPSDMYSDNGTNFVGAVNELKKQIQIVIKESEASVADKFTEDNVRWHFTPPGSPHFGGLWEAGVKSVKFHLHRVIGESTLSYEELSTLLIQIEACLNSRPMYASSSDPSDFTAITPAHFLVNTDLLSIPEPSLLDTNANRLSRWQEIQQMRQLFCKRWLNEYLSRLQNRPKWCNTSPNLKIGELVLIRDDRFSPNKWPLARIIDVHPGTDGCVRVVTVKTSTGTYRRNITKISRLPIDYEEARADDKEDQ